MKTRGLLILVGALSVTSGCARHAAHYGDGYPGMMSGGVRSSTYVIEPAYPAYYGGHVDVLHSHDYGDVRYRDRAAPYHREHHRLDLSHPDEYRKPFKYEQHLETAAAQRDRRSENKERRRQDWQGAKLNRKANRDDQSEQRREFSQHPHNEDRDRISRRRESEAGAHPRADYRYKNNRRENRGNAQHPVENHETRRSRIEAGYNWRREAGAN